jgi:hypothetical protein
MLKVKVDQKDPNILWNEVSESLMTEVGEATYRSWLAPLICSRYEDDVLFFSCPKPFYEGLDFRPL